MKKCLKKLNISGLALIVSIVAVSCHKDETSQDFNNGEVITATELKASDETELISEDIIGIGEDVYATDELLYSGKGNYYSDYLPECVTITKVITSNSIEKTIDFGEGCELPNGNVLGGIIYLSYAKDMEMSVKTLSLSLEDFTFNGVSVEGTSQVERTRSNADGNPQSDATWTFNATWPDGDTASFNGDRTREWIEGYGSGFWGDNVFLISGSATYTGKLGNVFTKATQTPLRREWSCRFIVSGILDISRNNATASLDFGDGSCDAKGILTYPNGESKEIFLRRFLK